MNSERLSRRSFIKLCLASSVLVGCGLPQNSLSQSSLTEQEPKTPRTLPLEEIRSLIVAHLSGRYIGEFNDYFDRLSQLPENEYLEMMINNITSSKNEYFQGSSFGLNKLDNPMEPDIWVVICKKYGWISSELLEFNIDQNGCLTSRPNDPFRSIIPPGQLVEIINSIFPNAPKGKEKWLYYPPEKASRQGEGFILNVSTDELIQKDFSLCCNGRVRIAANYPLIENFKPISC